MIKFNLPRIPSERKKNFSNKIKYMTTIKRVVSQLQRRDIADRQPKNRYNYSVRNAKRRGLCWKISFRQYKKLIAKPCTYCGEIKYESCIGLDRIDNAKGYIRSNVVPSCAVCNYMRNDLPVWFFLSVVRKIQRVLG